MIANNYGLKISSWFIYLVMTSIIMGRVLINMSQTIDLGTVLFVSYFLGRYFFFSSFSWLIFNKNKIETLTLCGDALVFVSLGILAQNAYLYHLALLPSSYGYFAGLNRKDIVIKSLFPLWTVWTVMATSNIVFKKVIFLNEEQFFFFFSFCSSFSVFALMNYQRWARRVGTHHIKFPINVGEKSLPNNNIVKDNTLSFESLALKDKYFFHDIINQTHGLVLFLGRKLKEGINTGINRDDTEFIYHEIQAIQQSIIKHYKTEDLTCKNFYLKDAFKSITYWISVYLSESNTKTLLELGPHLKKYLYDEKYMLDKIYFLRVVINLIKNIYDYKSREAHFHLDINDKRELVFIFKNSLHVHEMDMSQDVDLLLNEILNIHKKSTSEGPANRGLGLLGVEKILKDLNGDFSYQIDGGYFVVQGAFPLVDDDNEIIPTRKVA